MLVSNISKQFMLLILGNKVKMLLDLIMLIRNNAINNSPYEDINIIGNLSAYSLKIDKEAVAD